MSARCPFMCWAPFSKRQPSHCWHRADDAYGQSKRFERIGFGTTTSMPPTESISSRKRSKLTTAMWFTSSPVRSLTVFSVEGRAAELGGGVELRGAVPGDLDPQVARNREEGEPVLARVGADQHHRVGAMGVAAAGLRPTVGSEHEDRRRLGGEEAVLALQLGRRGSRDAVVCVLDPTGYRDVAPDEPDDERERAGSAARG